MNGKSGDANMSPNIRPQKPRRGESGNERTSSTGLSRRSGASLADHWRKKVSSTTKKKSIDT
jgi:hypothetical protein